MKVYTIHKLTPLVWSELWKIQFKVVMERWVDL